MIVRATELEDLEGLYEVEQESFSVPWSKESIQAELGDSTMKLYYVLEDQGCIMGYAGLWTVLDEGQITNIALRKICRGQGYGELLLRVLMEAAWKKDITHIFLEVRTSNFSALRLYRKLGYTVLGIRKEYYSEPLEDAYIMGCEKKNYPWVG